MPERVERVRLANANFNHSHTGQVTIIEYVPPPEEDDEEGSHTTGEQAGSSKGSEGKEAEEDDEADEEKAPDQPPPPVFRMRGRPHTAAVEVSKFEHEAQLRYIHSRTAGFPSGEP